MAKYKLNCYGWSLEAIGKSLTDEQVKKIEDLMKKAGYEELWEVRYDLEELLDIDIWDGDLFHHSAGMDNGTIHFEVIDEECVGCNLCMFACPVPDCITMERVDSGTEYQNWTTHQNNPMRVEEN